MPYLIPNIFLERAERKFIRRGVQCLANFYDQLKVSNRYFSTLFLANWNFLQNTNYKLCFLCKFDEIARYANRFASCVKTALACDLQNIGDFRGEVNPI
jgi:hypothetical protein